MAKVVKKFGGTSLGNEARINLAAKEVIESLEAGDEVVVVVSAMGSNGDPYATNTLIDLLEDVSPDVDSRKKDLMMSCGETISASLFSHYLDSEGYSAVPMTGHKAGIFTDDNFGDAEIIDIDPVRINHYTSQGKPVVLAGFQGRTVQGEVTTLGRGGSDTTALAVADGVGADRVELYTDVPGVAVADPEVVGGPEYFSELSLGSLARLAETGAGVVHPSAVRRARKSGASIEVKCSWNRDNETLVEEGAEPEAPVGITSRDGFTVFKGGSRELNRDGWLKERATDLVHLEGSQGLALVSEELNGDPGNGYERREGISAVTVVGTGSRPLSEIRRRVAGSVGDDDYLEKVSTDYGLRLLAERGQKPALIRGIYEAFYQG